MAQDTVDIVLNQRFITTVVNRSSPRMLIPKDMKIATYSAAATSFIDSQITAPQRKAITLRDSVNATQICKAL